MRRKTERGKTPMFGQLMHITEGIVTLSMTREKKVNDRRKRIMMKKMKVTKSLNTWVKLLDYKRELSHFMERKEQKMEDRKLRY